MKTTELPTEAAVMQAIATALTTASLIERPPYNGMYIRLAGTLSLAVRLADWVHVTKETQT